jgi:hypothetical protein
MQFSHPIRDALEKALPISETLSGKADTFSGSGARKTDHVFLYKNEIGIGIGVK